MTAGEGGFTHPTPRGFCPLGLGSWALRTSSWFEVTEEPPVSGGLYFTPKDLVIWDTSPLPPTIFLTLYAEGVGPTRTLLAVTESSNCLVDSAIPSWHWWACLAAGLAVELGMRLLAVCPSKQLVTFDRKPVSHEALGHGTV